jgi:hypothetical protein
MSFYDLEVNLLESVKDLKLSAAYYW